MHYFELKESIGAFSVPEPCSKLPFSFKGWYELSDKERILESEDKCVYRSKGVDDIAPPT